MAFIVYPMGSEERRSSLACFMRERANQGMHKRFFREDE
jgi:hypothetical protein